MESRSGSIPTICPPTFIAYNIDFEDADSDDPPLASDASVAVVAEAAACALGDRNVSFVPLRDSVAPLVATVDRHPDGVFFNLVESLGGDCRREPEVPAVLQKMGVAFTGCDASTLRVAVDKRRARQRLSASAVPIPRGGVARTVEQAVQIAKRLAFPVFVKPACADASIGVSQRSVVLDVADLRHQFGVAAQLGRDVVVEEYLPGPEINVAACPTGDGMLWAATAIDFSSFGAGLHPIVSYDAKWTATSDEYRCVSVPADEIVSSRVVEAALRAARDAVRSVRADGPIRIDLRLDANDRPRVIDVNPNPDLHPEAGFARACRQHGLDYPQMIRSLIDSASRRHHEHSRLSRARPARATTTPDEHRRVSAARK